jgi:menaquinone-specific isochorismate synthase
MIERGYTAAPERDLDVAYVRHLLMQKAGAALAGVPENGSDKLRIARVEVPVEPLDLFQWLKMHANDAKFFWSGREDTVSTAALGIADEVVFSAQTSGEDLDRLVARAADAPQGVRYYGGARFDVATPPDAEWKPFSAGRFVLPRFELSINQDRAVLACNLVLPQDLNRWPGIRAEIKQLRFPYEPLAEELPLPVSRIDKPEREEWIADVQQAVNAFRRGNLDKIVLARKVSFGFLDPLDPLVLLKHLKAVTPGCHHFYFQPGADANVAFLGASPERLYCRNGKDMLSEAVAGTRPRGDSPSSDQRLREELLHSDKDLREHAYVRQSIEEVLLPLCEEIQADQTTTEMALAQGRHLYSGVRARLNDDVSDADLLRALHPTPAVGGYPREAAMEALRRTESFDRGWYAGPIGWIGKGEADFAVAIRSGLVHDHTLSLFSGAGIVAGSVPELEHEEIEQKLSDFAKVLGLDYGRA